MDARGGHEKRIKLTKKRRLIGEMEGISGYFSGRNVYFFSKSTIPTPSLSRRGMKSPVTSIRPCEGYSSAGSLHRLAFASASLVHS